MGSGIGLVRIPETKEETGKETTCAVTQEAAPTGGPGLQTGRVHPEPRATAGKDPTQSTAVRRQVTGEQKIQKSSQVRWGDAAHRESGEREEPPTSPSSHGGCKARQRGLESSARMKGGQRPGHKHTCLSPGPGVGWGGADIPTEAGASVVWGSGKMHPPRRRRKTRTPPGEITTGTPRTTE